MSYCCVTYTWDPSKDDNISRCGEVCVCPPGLCSVKGVRLGVAFCQKPVRPPGGSGCLGGSVLCHFQEVSIKVLILLTEWEAKVILGISILHVASNLKSAGDTEGNFEQLRSVYRENIPTACASYTATHSGASDSERPGEKAGVAEHWRLSWNGIFGIWLLSSTPVKPSMEFNKLQNKLLMLDILLRTVPLFSFFKKQRKMSCLTVQIIAQSRILLLPYIYCFLDFLHIQVF